MTPFQYVEFYDYPRSLVLRHRGKLVLMQSAFDQGADEYPDNYTVYLLPNSVAADLSRGDWEFLGKLILKPIGQIQIAKIAFDPTRRKQLESAILDDLISES
ncbi:MAG: hypothetical protein LAN36_11185 [Acidobacteriia bacterium]|nr:hypothetical protein [Terriglobia bacterium]